MGLYKKIESRHIYMGKLAFGEDLLLGLTDICVKENINLGWVEAIGAVQKAKVAFYNQRSHKYQNIVFSKSMEILKLTGNVSMRGGSPIVHAHIILSDEDGKAFGGHLLEGTVVFACEFIINRYYGPKFDRGHDSQTDLPLWDML